MDLDIRVWFLRKKLDRNYIKIKMSLERLKTERNIGKVVKYV